ncbi:hypothetical protein PQX77_020858 [Marasmius sp. AFHP31]|nr:hypothetical protein PQX77_020858 [Marasmius sp. AFHP31]
MSIAMHSRFFPLFDHARRPWPIFTAEIGDLDHDLGPVVAARMWKYARVDEKTGWGEYQTPYIFPIGPYIFEVWRAGTWQIAGYFAWHFFAGLSRQHAPCGLYQLRDIHVDPGIGQEEADKIIDFVFEGKNPKAEYEKCYVGLHQENAAQEWNCYGRHLPDLDEGTVLYDATTPELIEKYGRDLDTRARLKIGKLDDFTQEDYDSLWSPHGGMWARYEKMFAIMSL